MFTGIIEEVGRTTSAQPGNLVIAASAVIVITVVVGMALFWLLVHLHQDRDADKAI